MKNDIINLIEEHIDFTPNINDLNNKIYLNKYLNQEEQKKNKLKIKYSFLIMSLLLISLISILFFTQPIYKYHQQNNTIIYYNDYEFTSAYDHILLIKINDKTTTKLFKDTGTDIPYTFYSFDLIMMLKGDNDYSNSQICFYGGNKNFKTIELLSNNKELLEEGKYYLIFSNKKNKTSNNDRIENNDLIITDSTQKIKLDNYLDSLTVNQQNPSIKLIINRYLNIINQEIDNQKLNYNIPKSIEELVKNNDFISIIKINNEKIRQNINNGFGSDIPSTSYNIEIIQNFKNQILSKTLYCYGTNFWESEKNFNQYVSVLNENEIYLAIGNPKANDCENTLINTNDIIIYDNIQLVKLENYNIEKHYTKQEQSIIDTLEQYLIYIQCN